MIQLGVRRDLPTAWVDTMRVYIRKDTPVAILAFFQGIADTSERIEVTRVATSLNHLNQIIDVLCRVTEHYPKPEKGTKQTGTTKKKDGK